MPRKNKFDNHSDQHLTDALAAMTTIVATSVFTMAEILVEMKSRGMDHDLMRRGPLRWYKEIASFKLDPEVALHLGGNASLVPLLLPLKVGTQLSLCTAGTLIAFPEIGATGKIVTTERTLFQLSTTQLAQIFCETGIRSRHEQLRILHSDQKKSMVRQTGRVRVDVKAGILMCGAMKLEPQELVPALRALGYKLQRIKGFKG